MPDLLTHPLHAPEHLGLPIPDSAHAVSAALPTWRDVVGYEEGEPRVIEALRSGYPRFVYHPLVRRLFETCRAAWGDSDGDCVVFPCRAAAERCAAFLEAQGAASRVRETRYDGVFAVAYAADHAPLVRAYWQHAGEGLSSRHAAMLLEDRSAPDADEAEQHVRRRIADAYGVASTDVLLYPTGMAAIYHLHRALGAAWPGRPAAQFGFPYVDTLKVLQKFGCGAMFYHRGDAADLEQLASAVAAQPVCGIFTEVPSNPLLTTPNLMRLAAVARSAGVPLVVDDTITTAVNVDCLGLADVVCTSLTKNFSGAGDVAGGALIVRPDGRHTDRLRGHLDVLPAPRLFAADAIQLEANSRDFVERVRRCSAAANRLVEHLAVHPAVERVCYPDRCGNDCYEQVRRVDGGYGALVSVVVRGDVQAAARFYDSLRVCKGPNLGTNFTLACPFTLLAHYHELDWAEACGVPRRLIRISVGLEAVDDLIARCDEALDRAVTTSHACGDGN